MLKRTTRLERLAKKEERETVKRIISLSFLSLILAILLFTLGIPLLGKFADFLDLFFKKSETVTVSKEIPNPPRLNPLPSATNSAQLTVDGFSDTGTKVVIYLNSEKAGETNIADGKFHFEDLFLKKGENRIWAKTVSFDERESDSSQSQIIIQDLEEPRLLVETPIDNQSFSGDNRIKVLGKTEKDAQVYANGFLASVDLEGKFEVFVPVAEGETTLEVKAIDEAGNIKVETRKVTFRK